MTPPESPPLAGGIEPTITTATTATTTSTETTLPAKARWSYRRMLVALVALLVFTVIAIVVLTREQIQPEAWGFLGMALGTLGGIAQQFIAAETINKMQKPGA